MSPALNDSRLDRHRVFDWHVGTNIRYLRILKDIEQQDMARHADMDKAQLCRVENGSRSLKFKEAIAIAQMLGVRPERLTRIVTNNKGDT